MKKLCGNAPMPWRRVLVLAILCGAVTALVCLVPALANSDLHDIAVVPDAWFLPAVFIAVNCKTWKEAGLKCFVFFLVSQPLVYLIQVPFSTMGWGLFSYYKYWFVITLFTLPGGAIAWLLRRKDWCSVSVLAVANLYLAIMAALHLHTAHWKFPEHLFSGIFCLALAVFFTLVLLDEKKHRRVSLALIGVAFLISVGVNLYRTQDSVEIALPEGPVVCQLEDKGVVTAETTDGWLALKAVHDGNTLARLTGEDGSEIEIYITVSNGNILWQQID